MHSSCELLIHPTLRELIEVFRKRHPEVVKQVEAGDHICTAQRQIHRFRSTHFRSCLGV